MRVVKDALSQVAAASSILTVPSSNFNPSLLPVKPGSLAFDTTSKTLKLFDGDQWTSGSASLPSLQNGSTWIGNSSNVAQPVTISGDVTISNTGNATVQGIQHVPVSSTAPLASQVLIFNGTTWAPGNVALNSLPNGKVWVGDSSNIPQPVFLSNDVNITNTGAATVEGIKGVPISNTAPVISQVLTYDGTQWLPSAGENARNVLIVRKNPGIGQFLTIGSAMASISSSSSTNRYTIYVQNGDYTENQIVVKNYVFIVGQSEQNVRISPFATGYPLFLLNNTSSISFLTIMNTDPTFPAVSMTNYGSNEVFMHKLSFVNCQRGILCAINGSAAANAYCRLEYINFTGATQYAITCQDTGGPSFSQIVSLQNCVSQSHCNDCLIVNGPNTSLFVDASVFAGDGAGNGITVMNGGKLKATGATLTNWGNCVLTTLDAGTPDLQLNGVLLLPSATAGSKNVNVLNTNTTGNYTG